MGKDDFLCFVDSHMDEVKKTCEDSGVDFWEWNVCLAKDMFGYYREVTNKELIKNIYLKKDKGYSDEYLLKNILQSQYPFGYSHWMQQFDLDIDKYRSRVFKFLDSVDEPYFYIFTPVWFYKTEVYQKGYYAYLEPNTGISEMTMFISREYAKHKIGAYDTI